MNINNPEILKVTEEFEKILFDGERNILAITHGYVALKKAITELIEKENELIKQWNKAIKGCGVAYMDWYMLGWPEYAKQENIMAVIFQGKEGYTVFSTDPVEMAIARDKCQISACDSWATYADYATAHYYAIKMVRNHRNKI